MTTHMILWRAALGAPWPRRDADWPPRLVADDPVSLPPRRGTARAA